MNEQLKNFAKSELIAGLEQCTGSQFRLFKQMYCHQNLDATIKEAVDSIPDENIDWAMQQVGRTVNKNNRDKQ